MILSRRHPRGFHPNVRAHVSFGFRTSSSTDAFYWHGLTLIPAWINNYIDYKVCYWITFPSLNISGVAIEVWECITLGSHEACVRAKHPSLTIPAPSRGEPNRHLGSSYQQGVSCLHCLLTWVACGAHPCRSSMVAPGDYFQDNKEASGILIIKSQLHIQLVYYSRSTTHFISLALEINNVLVYLVKDTCGRKK